MKNYKIFGSSLKNPPFRREFRKNQYRGGDCLKRGRAWTVCRFEGGGDLARKRVVVLLREWGAGGG